MSYQHHIARCAALGVRPMSYVQYVRTLNNMGV